MSKRLKTLMAHELSEVFREHDSCVLVGVHALSVEKSGALRNELRDTGASLKVLKNRIAKFALEEVGYGELSEHLSGTSAVAFGGEGALTISRILVTWERKLPDRLIIRAGMLDGKVLEREDVHRLATIPDRPTLLAMLAAVVVAPVGQIACLVGEMMASVARGIGALAEKREEDAQAPTNAEYPEEGA